MLHHPLIQASLTLAGGALITLSLAPFDIWPLAIVGLYVFLHQLLRCTASSRAWWTGWLFGVGMFGSGASWVYVSIHTYGNAPVALAVLLTTLFCLGLALLPAALALLFHRYIRLSKHLNLLAFVALWVLFEWLRSWLLTGFPWLYVGYSASDTWLSGWAPLGGIYALSLLVCGSAIALYTLIHGKPGQRMLAAGITACFWLTGYALDRVSWVVPVPDGKVSIAIVQANIPQELKWLPEYYQPTLDLYQTMTLPLLGHDLVIWPEAAIPNYFHRAQPFLGPMSARMLEAGSSLLTGIPHVSEDGKGYHNSIAALGKGTGVYHKQRLVPFGEYVPLEGLLRGLIDFFNLPMSNFTPGSTKQSGLVAGPLKIAPFICYEVVYPALVRSQISSSDLLVTISNDSWFGESIGPLQHLQMARMRALENGRYLVRGTNNGVSAIIDERGKIIAETRQFEAATLVGDAIRYTGNTPFTLFGSLPVLLICSVLLCGAAFQHRSTSSRHP